MSMAFKVGDRVRWTSQSGGYTKTKKGEVVRVLDAGAFLGRVVVSEQLRAQFDTSPIDGTMYGMREHESYLVAVEGGSRGRRRLYWPLVKNLEAVESARRTDTLKMHLENGHGHVYLNGQDIPCSRVIIDTGYPGGPTRVTIVIPHVNLDFEASGCEVRKVVKSGD